MQTPGATAAVAGSGAGEARRGGGAVAALVARPPRGEVSAFAYQLLNAEMVRLLCARGQVGRLETLGFEIGYRFAERFARGHAKFVSTLEVIKFLCKELWSALFGKQVDKLQTNYKGVFVLHDNSFSWCVTAEVDYQDDASVDEAKRLLIVPCGLLRGALANLGVISSVRAEFTALPACRWTGPGRGLAGCTHHAAVLVVLAGLQFFPSDPRS
jgi:hypothetical protein